MEGVKARHFFTKLRPDCEVCTIDVVGLSRFHGFTFGIESKEGVFLSLSNLGWHFVMW